MKKWYIRVDCEENEKVGTGHLYRSIVFASFLQRKGDTVKFLINDNELAKTLVRKNQFEYLCVDEHDINLAEKYDYIFIDLYEKYVDPEIMETFKRIADTVIVITDTFEREEITADFVILTNASAFDHYPDSPEYIKGVKYIIMDDAFYLKREIRNHPVRNILVAFGGYDPFNVTQLAVNALEKIQNSLKSVRINILLGALYPFRKNLLKMLKNTELNYSIYSNVDDIVAFYSESDYAVTAAGNTFYELSALGVPASVIAQTLRQKRASEENLRQWKFDFIGYYEDVSEDEIVKHLSAMLNSEEKCEQISKAGLAYFKDDGKTLVYNRVRKESYV